MLEIKNSDLPGVNFTLDHQSSMDLRQEYILTPEEEESVIAHAKKTFLLSKVSKLIGLGYKRQQIEEKLKEYDLNKIFHEEKRKELLNTANQTNFKSYGMMSKEKEISR